MFRKLIALSFLMLAGLACNLTGATIATPDPGILQTAVAGTLTASAPATAVPTVEAATPVPPTATPEPPATDAPSPAPVASVCNIAYVDGSQLFCLNESGVPVLLAEMGVEVSLSSPAISSDGALVAYSIDSIEGMSQLIVVDADGANPRLVDVAGQVLTGGPDAVNSAATFQWQAGTHTIFFNTRYTPKGGPVGPGEYINADLWKVNVDTGEILNVLSRQSAGLFALSPDGQYVALSSPQSVGVMRADGSAINLAVITFPPVITYSEYQLKPPVVWNPDSTFFSLVLPSADPLAPDASAIFYRITSGGAAQALATLPGNFLFGGPVAGDFSPDGQFVAYGRSETDGSAATLFFVSADGAKTQSLFKTLPFFGLGWSPDSQRYALSVEGANVVVGVDGGSLPFAPGAVGLTEMRWLDNEVVVFAAEVDGQRGIYQQRLGQEVQLLAGGVRGNVSLAVRK